MLEVTTKAPGSFTTLTKARSRCTAASSTNPLRTPDRISLPQVVRGGELMRQGLAAVQWVAPGTHVVARDLFFNQPVRRRAMQAR